MTNLASLRRWRPRTWNPDGETFETFDTAGEAGNQPVLVDMDEILENRDLVTLHRAAGRNELAERLFRPEPALKGTTWYDNLERIVAMRIECDCGVPNATITLECPRSETLHNAGNQASARSIAVIAILRRGTDTRTLKLQTDFAVADEYEPDPTRAGVILTTDTELGIEELAERIHDAVFEPGGDENDDSVETQLEDSREDAHYAACKLLLDETTAETERIRYSIQHRVAHLIPEGRTVRIVKHPGIEAIEVEVSSQ